VLAANRCLFRRNSDVSCALISEQQHCGVCLNTDSSATMELTASTPESRRRMSFLSCFQTGKMTKNSRQQFISKWKEVEKRPRSAGSLWNKMKHLECCNKTTTMWRRNVLKPPSVPAGHHQSCSFTFNCIHNQKYPKEMINSWCFSTRVSLHFHVFLITVNYAPEQWKMHKHF